jgi:hypothetical protein
MTPVKIRPQTAIEASYNNALELVAKQVVNIETLTKRVAAAEKENAKLVKLLGKFHDAVAESNVTDEIITEVNAALTSLSQRSVNVRTKVKL